MKHIEQRPEAESQGMNLCDHRQLSTFQHVQQFSSHNIKHVKRLSQKKFEQPEGLTFTSNGDLFISSEGQKKKARIYKFNYFPKS